MIVDDLSKRVVIPALKRCAVCEDHESEHGKAEHDGIIRLYQAGPYCRLSLLAASTSMVRTSSV